MFGKKTQTLLKEVLAADEDAKQVRDHRGIILYENAAGNALFGGAPNPFAAFACVENKVLLERLITAYFARESLNCIPNPAHSLIYSVVVPLKSLSEGAVTIVI